VGYLLVHGGATTGHFWDWVVPHLDAAALAVNLPGRLDRPADLDTLTVDAAAASVVRDVESSALADDADIVLVAHSSGGLEVPSIVVGLGPERLRGMVLNAASVPPEGGNGFDCMRARHRELSLLAVTAADASGERIRTPKPDPGSMRTSSGEELSDEQHAFITDPARCVEDSFNLYRQPVCWSRVADVPVTYILNLRDRALPLELQREMAARLPRPATVIELDAGHLAAVTCPEALAALICRAAAEMGAA
jgi:pimeloyl-ACP methyl ester carboxylesterase